MFFVEIGLESRVERSPQWSQELAYSLSARDRGIAQEIRIPQCLGATKQWFWLLELKLMKSSEISKEEKV